VFDGFRGQAQRTRADAAEGLYKHALALRDAGDIDGCLQALQDAARSPQLRFAAASLVGRLLRREGRMSQATEWLERAAQVPAPNPGESHELLYELGETLEASGEGARALAVLLELQADAGEYRDIAARIDRLTKTQDQG
jgi:tetratricopeptide (TPR) repeat protein